MSKIDLGKIALRHDGAWNASRSYEILTSVTHNGSLWICVADNFNVEPGTNGDIWSLGASKGDTGEMSAEDRAILAAALGIEQRVDELGDTLSANVADLLARIEQRVPKTAGKGLSTNDYTNADKAKLAGIENNAQRNVKSDWLAASGDAQILNKPDFDGLAAQVAALDTKVNILIELVREISQYGPWMDNAIWRDADIWQNIT